MSATLTLSAPIDYVRLVVSLNKSGDVRGAVEIADRAARKYPDFKLPVVGGTFGQMAEQLRGSLPQDESAQVATPETQTLRLVHDGKAPTTILGVEKDSAAHKILGRDGFKLGFFPANRGWYVRKSGGYAADLPLIAEIVKALESPTHDGTDVPLYRVDQSIASVHPETGAPLVKRETREQRAEWQREYDHRTNAAEWNLTFGKAECVTCGRKGLDLSSGSITRDERKLPQVQCGTCTGASIDMGALARELDSEPAPVPESANCPLCRTLVEVVDGQLKMHSKPFTGGFCKGKLGVTPEADVEAEPAPEPKRTRKATTRKATPQAETTRKAAPKSDDYAERVAALRAELEAAERKLAEQTAKREAEADKLATVGTSWVFRTVEGISGTTLKNSATSARQDLPRAFRKAGIKVQSASEQGVKVEVRRDREARTLVATIIDLPEGGVSAAKLAKIVRSVVSSQRGIVSATRA